MPVEHLFLVRHGETEANEKGIEAGPLDFHLTKKGRRDVRFIAKMLSKVKVRAVYSSPVRGPLRRPESSPSRTI